MLNELVKHAFLSSFGVLLLLPALALASLFTPVLSFADTGSWQTTTMLPDYLASHASQVYNGKVFVVGGANSVAVPENIAAIGITDGTLQSWVASPVQSPGLFQHASVIHENHVYLLGGSTYPPTNTGNTVYMGTVDQQGTISDWTPLTPLPVSVSQGAAAIVGTTIYFAGGETELNGAGQASGGVNQNIYAAAINNDGTIGNWTQVGSLPTPLYGFGMIPAGTNLIILGGQDNTSTYHAQTYTAPVNGDGTVGSWQQTSSLPEALYRASIITTQTTVFVAGGIDNGTFSDKVYFSAINADGTLGTWSQSQALLPHPICCAALSTLNGYLYLTGGYASDVGYLNTVYFAQAVQTNKITALNPVTVWISKNLLNIGMKLDLKAEVYKDTTLVSSGQLNSVTVGTGGNPTSHPIAFNSFSPVDFPAGSQLKVQVYARNACSGSLLGFGTANLYYNSSAQDSRFGATIGTMAATYHLRDGFLLDTAAGTSQKSISVAAGAKCSPFKSFGTWTITP